LFIINILKGSDQTLERGNIMEQTRTQILQKDIMNLLEKIKEERSNYKTTQLIKKDGIPSMVFNSEIKPNEKDYNDYKRLIETLNKSINTYSRLEQENIDNQFKYDYYKGFYKTLIEKIENEINNVHSLMEDSLTNNRLNQYRCLNYVYLILIEKTPELVNNCRQVDIKYLKNLSNEVVDKIECTEEFLDKYLSYAGMVSKYFDDRKYQATLNGIRVYVNNKIDDIKIIYK
jgi:hypothetical protein